MGKASDSGTDGVVPYIEELEGWVLDERKVITFRWLALELSVTANAAKKMLYDFCQKLGATKVWATYLVMGRVRNTLEVKVVPAKALDSAREAFDTVTSVHVYSVQAAPSSTPSRTDISAQLWATDMEHSKEMVERSTDAGNSLRSHRLSGVRCPSVDDVPPPPAPTPPDVLEQQSPFGNRSKVDGVNGAAGRKATETIASVPTQKPKGKVIDPKDFFRASAGVGAAATAAKDKGKGKGPEKAETKRVGSIDDFFSKAPATLVLVTPKSELVSAGEPKDDRRDECATRSDAVKEKSSNINGQKDRDEMEAGEDEGRVLHGKESKDASRGGRSRVTKRGRSTMVISDDKEEDDNEDEGGGGRDVGHESLQDDGAPEEEGSKRGRCAEKGADGVASIASISHRKNTEDGDEQAGIDDDGEGEEEVEWDDGGSNKVDVAPSKPSDTASISGSKRLSSCGESRAPEDFPADSPGTNKALAVSGMKEASDSCAFDGRDRSGVGGVGGPVAKKPKTARETSAKASDAHVGGKKAGPSKAKAPRASRVDPKEDDRGEESGDEDGQGRGGARGKRGRKGGNGTTAKRRGRYDTDEEEDDEDRKGDDKTPVRGGAMDKFTARNGVDSSGTRRKRTKVVLKGRTYMDEKGYMKAVNEEVEVTDDDEPSKPSAARDGDLQPFKSGGAGGNGSDDAASPGESGTEGKQGRSGSKGGSRGGSKGGSNKAASGPRLGGGSKAGAKKTAAKISKGKQSSMMGFLKKA